MAETQGPGGAWYGWDQGQNNLKARFDANFQLLDRVATVATKAASVLKHGAVADYNKATYAGTNNQAAFQAAATEAASLGVPLLVPEGSYYLGSKFDCSTDIIGNGEICIDHRTALHNPGYGGSIASLPVAVVWSGRKRVIHGINFWAPGRHKYDPALPGAVNGGMYCFVLVVGTVGTPSVGNLITGCRAFGAHYGAIMIGSYCRYTAIHDNDFEGNGYQVLYDNMSTGFKAVDSYGITVEENRFRGADWTSDATAWATSNSAWGGDPIEINAPLDGTSNVRINGNEIYDVYSSTPTGGIGIGLAKCRGFEVLGNFLDRTHHDGIHVEDDSYDGEVLGNHVYRATQGAGSGAITCEKSYGITFDGNVVSGAIAINGGTSYGGPFLPDTTDDVVVTNNKTKAPIYVINQSNVTVRGNTVVRISGTAPSAGYDGIQITVGPATASSAMKTIIVENNVVKGFYRGISVTGYTGGFGVTNFRVRRNYCPPNAASAAPAADKSVFVDFANCSDFEIAENEDIGTLTAMRYYTGAVPEGNVYGNPGDIVSGNGGYATCAWIKMSGAWTTGNWLPLGHMGVSITDRTDGTAPDGIARHIRYRGTGGHAFTLPAGSDTGRKLTFTNWGTGAAITITPAAGTIQGVASISLPPGFSVTLVNDNSSSWSIESHGGRSTGWAADTGTSKTSANATYTAPTASGTYSQAEMQAVMNSLQGATQTIRALKNVLLDLNVIGA